MALDLTLNFKTPRDGVSWLLAVVSVLILAVCVWQVWGWLQPSSYQEDVQVEIAAQKAGQAATVITVPELKLNTTGQRLGPEATVDPGEVGKVNPFR